MINVVMMMNLLCFVGARVFLIELLGAFALPNMAIPSIALAQPFQPFHHEERFCAHLPKGGSLGVLQHLYVLATILLFS